MIASLILSNASTAGIMSEGAVQSLGVKRKLDLDKIIKASIFGPTLVVKLLNTLVGKGGLTGINFGLSSLLRQSQIFTTTVGTFFQLAGAYLDVSLAPLMPGIMRGLTWLSSQIPRYSFMIDNLWTFIETKWALAQPKIEQFAEWFKNPAKILEQTIPPKIQNQLKLAGETYLEHLGESYLERSLEYRDKTIKEKILGSTDLILQGDFGEFPDLKTSGLLQKLDKSPVLDTGGGGGVYGAFGGNGTSGAAIPQAIPQKTPSVFKPESSAILPGAMLMRPEFGVADRRENNQVISQTHGQFGSHVGATIGQASGGGDSAGTTNILTTFFRNQGNEEAAQRMIANEVIMTRSGGSVHSLYQPKVQTYQAVASLHGSSVSIARESSQARTARTNIISRHN
tara:strand:+ start:2868 stop:4058 length:1191 start_codon:yes stop_codon:yes gene_type:complete